MNRFLVALVAGLMASSGLAQTAPAGPAAGSASGVATEAPDPGGSQVRIVRLSQVRGAVQMDRNTGRGYEVAFANIPVVAGAKLRTGEGIAEIEFEDNSTMRLAPGSEAEFVRLSRSPAGLTQTTVRITKGTGYISLQKSKTAGEFVLEDGAAQIVPAPGAHLRWDASKPQGELAVFEGSVQVAVGPVNTTVGRRQTVDVNPTMQTVSFVQKGTEEYAWDEWDKAQAGYHKNVAALTNTGGFGLYGVNDLNYYGSFVDLPGCGSVWQPYFVSAAWDPFANGTWAYYPGAGYSWVSPYPWGWLPYHSGAWMNCGGAGWGWRPGGAWMGLTNSMAMRIAKHPHPHPVPPAPVRRDATLIPVNMKPLAVSGMTDAGRFTFKQDSAGLGVPRDGFAHLNSFNSHVAQQGFVHTEMPSRGIAVAAGAAGNARVGSYGVGSAGNTAWGRNGGAPSGSGHAFAGSASSAGGYHGGASSGMASAAPSAPSAGAGGGAAAASGGAHH